MKHFTPRNSADRHDSGLSRAVVETVDDTKLMQEHQHSLFGDEKQDKNEHAHPYGFTSVPKKPSGTGKMRAAAEAFMSYMGAGRSHGVAVMVGDRRFRLYKLAEGEVGMHDDQGHQVHFQRDGIWVSAPNSKKVVAQIMDDDKLPQDPNAPMVSGQKMGQIKQAGRPAAINFTLDKNSLTINHPVAVNINSATINLAASAHLNLKGGAGVHTVGKTHLGVDSNNEIAVPLVPDVNLDPAKQTFVKIG